VSVFDVVNVRLDREIAVGQNPVAIAASPTRNEIYAVNSGIAGGQGSVSVIHAETNTVAGTITVHSRPVSIEIDAAGDRAYVANAGSNTISVLDLKARREIAAIGVGEEPVAARIAPDGGSLVVVNRHSGSVTIVDPAALHVRSVFNGCPGAADVVILPDASKSFVACSGSHQVMVLSLARSEARPARPGAAPSLPAQPDRLETLLDVGQGPVQLALKPDGGEVFVANSLSNSVSEVYNTTDEVGDTYMIGDFPVRSLVSLDNSLLYTANLHSQYVTVYSIDDGKRLGSIHVGDGPAAMAFSGSGLLIFVVDSGSGEVAVVRTATRSLFTLLPTGRSPNAIAIKAFKVR
jgi:YVTN family beta-propeller protein